MALQAKALSTRLSIDKNLNRTYTSKYLVPNSSVWENPLNIINANGIPAYWASYTWNGLTDPYAVFKSLNCDPRSKDPKLESGGRGRDWEVTITHSTMDPPQRDPQTPRSNPLLEPPVVSGSFMSRMVNVVRDKDDEPIINTAKMPFDPPIQAEDSFDTLSISYNTPTIDLEQRAEYRNTVNSTEIWGLEPRQVKLARWGWTVRYIPGLVYIAHQFEFHINYDSFSVDAVNQGGGDVTYKGFHTLLANRGYQQLVDDPDGSPGDKIHKRIFDEFDEPLTEPSKLNEDGTLRAPSEEETWLVFKIEKEKDFTDIPGMPTTLPGPFV